MNARTWFNVGARLLGLWSIYTALGYLVSLVVGAVERAIAPHSPPPEMHVLGYFLFVIGYAGFGLFLLLHAGHLANRLFACACSRCGCSTANSTGVRCPDCGAGLSPVGEDQP